MNPDGELEPTIELDEAAVVRGIRHGVELYADRDVEPGDRELSRFVNTRLVGKLGEEALVAFLGDHYGIEAAVDYDIYGYEDVSDYGDVRHVVGDDGEHYFPETAVEVKTTKPYNRWLAVREREFETQPSDAPFVLVQCDVGREIDLDAWDSPSVTWGTLAEEPLFLARLATMTGGVVPVEATIAGTAYPPEFTHTFEAGERLVDPETGDEIGSPMTADNVAIPIQDLDRTAGRWDRVVSDIVRTIPVEFEGLVDD